MLHLVITLSFFIIIIIFNASGNHLNRIGSSHYKLRIPYWLRKPARKGKIDIQY